MTGTQHGPDGQARCPWGLSSPEYLAYHDAEWGRPVGNDRQVFEKLCLEGFQAGLSWLTILRKRDAFRRAFANFDPTSVAGFGEADIDRLLSDAGIVRHRAKILATINNAQAAVSLADKGVSLAGLLWSYEPSDPPVPRKVNDLLPSTPQSKALSAELRRYGFRFVGPTTVYAAMQSLGVVNDHLHDCHCRELARSERSTFKPPSR